jgi:hypothetical protein
MDTASHLLATLAHYEKGEPVGHQDDSASHQAEVSLPEAAEGRRQDDIPAPMALIAVPNPYSYLTSMEQLVRAMAAGTSNIAPRPERVVTL